MRPPKEIWTNNYNEYILDLYDANPMVQTPNGTTKKAPEPNKNPRKTEASPKESSGNLTTIVTESLRLRNTAVLNVKLAEKIFKWEKERLAKIKPFPDPKDDDDEGGEIIIEDIDEDDFKFPRFRFPKPPKPPTKPPNPPSTPPTAPAPVTPFEFNFPWWIFPLLKELIIPERVAQAQTSAVAAQAGGLPLAGVAKRKAANVRTVAGSGITEISNSRQSFNRTARNAAKQVGGPPVRGSATTATAVMERPTGARGGTGAGGGSGFLGGTGKGTAMNNPLYWTKSFTDELNRRTSQWIPPNAKNSISKFLRRFEIGNFVKDIYSAKSKTPPPSITPNTTNTVNTIFNPTKTPRKTGSTSLNLSSKQIKTIGSRVFETPEARYITNIADDVVPLEETFAKAEKSAKSPSTSIKPSPKFSLGNSLRNAVKVIRNNPRTFLAGGAKGVAGGFIGIGADLLMQKGFSELELSQLKTFVTDFQKADPEKQDRIIDQLLTMRQEEINWREKDTFGKASNAILKILLLGGDTVSDDTLRFAESRLNALGIPLDSKTFKQTGGKTVVDTGFVTGPSNQIGGSSEYHIDTKFSDRLSDEDMLGHLDNLALGYQRMGRTIEFSNGGVAGLRWDPSADIETKRTLLRKVIAAHAPSEGFHSIDYYVPSIKSADRWDKSAEGAPILTPRVEGGTVTRYSDFYGEYGRYVVVTDKDGNIILKTGHGDLRYGPKDGVIKIEPTSNSKDVKVVTPKGEQEVSSRVLNTDEDGKDEEDAMMMLDSIFRTGTLIGSQPDIIPLPIQMSQPESSVFDKINYSTWGHPIKAG